MNKYFKLLFSVFISLSIILTPLAQAEYFSDLKNNYDLASTVYYLQERGIISGYPDGTFQPQRVINRAEALKIIFESRGIPVEDDVNSGFPDVPTNEWYAKYVTTAKKLGIIKGYNDGTYKPTQEVNRAEFIKMAMAAQNYYRTPGDYLPAFYAYSDISLGEWYIPYLTFAVNNKFLTDNKGQMDPTAGMTRENAAYLIANITMHNEKHPELLLIEREMPEPEISTELLSIRKDIILEHAYRTVTLSQLIDECNSGYIWKSFQCVKETEKDKIIASLKKNELPSAIIINQYKKDEESKNNLYLGFIEILQEASLIKKEERQVELIYDWITKNLSYDVELFPKGNDRFDGASYTWQGALENKVAVCGGYSQLFAKALDILGIQNEKVSGKSDSYSGYGDHGWNKVLINGEWYYYDITWDSGAVDENNNFKRKTTRDYYMIPKECMRLRHSEPGEEFLSGEELIIYPSLHKDKLLAYCPEIYDNLSRFSEFITNKSGENNSEYAHVYFFHEKKYQDYEEFNNFITKLISSNKYEKIKTHIFDTGIDQNNSLMWQIVHKLDGDNSTQISYPYIVISNMSINGLWGKWVERGLEVKLEKCEKNPEYCAELDLLSEYSNYENNSNNILYH